MVSSHSELLQISSLESIEELHDTIRNSIPHLFNFPDSGSSDIRRIAASSFSDLADFCEWQSQFMISSLFGVVDDLRGLIYDGISPLIGLLNDRDPSVQSCVATSSLGWPNLVRGEFVL